MAEYRIRAKRLFFTDTVIFVVQRKNKWFWNSIISFYTSGPAVTYLNDLKKVEAL